MRDSMAFKWTNGVFIPAQRFADKAREHFAESVV